LIEPLTKQFDRWLTAVLLLGWHIQIVHENEAPFAYRRTVDTFATPTKTNANSLLSEESNQPYRSSLLMMMSIV